MNIKKIFDLQLFAEGESETSNSENTSNSQNEVNAKSQKTYTEEELNAIIDKRYARWQAQAQKQASQAERYAQLSSDDKVKELEKQIKELNQRQAKSDMTRNARVDLKERNIDLDDDLLEMLVVSDDAEKTKSNIKNFADLFEKAVESKVKETLKGNAPKTKTSNITKEDIMKIKDRSERQRLIKENIELFK